MAAAAHAGERVQVAPQGYDVTIVLGKEPLRGYLARPPDAARHPAIVELHGCAGFGEGDIAAADRLQSLGYAALALASLGDFNACGNGANGALAEAYDAFQALDWLAQQSFADPDHTAILGFGMGGSGALDAVERGSIGRLRTRRFAAAIAFYPACRDREGVMTVPTLILSGDRDDWAPANWCRDMVAGRDRRGAPITLLVYPEAAHDFDVPGPRRQYLGHVLAHDPDATAVAWRRVPEFLQSALARQ
jgi:dienelactone hydrolase